MTDKPFKVNAYMNAIPPGNKNPEKPKLLQYFIEGVQASGDKGMIVSSYTLSLIHISEPTRPY